MSFHEHSPAEADILISQILLIILLK